MQPHQVQFNFYWGPLKRNKEIEKAFVELFTGDTGLCEKNVSF